MSKKEKTWSPGGETSELVVLWAEVVLLLPHVPVQTLRQALEPVVDRVLETDGGDGEAGSGDGYAERGEEKEKCLSDGSFANTMAQGRAVDMQRCNFPAARFVCERGSLTHSYGQRGDWR